MSLSKKLKASLTLLLFSGTINQADAFCFKNRVPKKDLPGGIYVEMYKTYNDASELFKGKTISKGVTGTFSNAMTYGDLILPGISVVGKLGDIGDKLTNIILTSKYKKWDNEFDYNEQSCWNRDSIRDQLGENTELTYFIVFTKDKKKALYAGYADIRAGIGFDVDDQGRFFLTQYMPVKNEDTPSDLRDPDKNGINWIEKDIVRDENLPLAYDWGNLENEKNGGLCFYNKANRQDIVYALVFKNQSDFKKLLKDLKISQKVTGTTSKIAEGGAKVIGAIDNMTGGGGEDSGLSPLSLVGAGVEIVGNLSSLSGVIAEDVLKSKVPYRKEVYHTFYDPDGRCWSKKDVKENLGKDAKSAFVVFLDASRSNVLAQAKIEDIDQWNTIKIQLKQGEDVAQGAQTSDPSIFSISQFLEESDKLTAEQLEVNAAGPWTFAPYNLMVQSYQANVSKLLPNLLEKYQRGGRLKPSAKLSEKEVRKMYLPLQQRIAMLSAKKSIKWEGPSGDELAQNKINELKAKGMLK